MSNLSIESRHILPRYCHNLQDYAEAHDTAQGLPKVWTKSEIEPGKAIASDPWQARKRHLHRQARGYLVMKYREWSHPMIHQNPPNGSKWNLLPASLQTLTQTSSLKGTEGEKDETTPPTHPQHPATNPKAAHHGTTSNSNSMKRRKSTTVSVSRGQTTKREPKHRSR